MTDPIFYIAKRFFPVEEYERFSKIVNRAEIVTYDVMLCEIVDEYGLSGSSPYAGEVDDLGILLQIPIKEDEQIIAYFENPTESHVLHTFDVYFEFCGYDLSEKLTGISAVTNCGGMFDKAISYEKLNKYGLIDDYEAVLLTRKLLDGLYPDESHAECEIYEIWRRL
jgi:hypothetical protein